MATQELVKEVSLGSRRRRIASSLRRAPLISLTIIVTVGLSAILADFIAPYSPYEISLENSLQPPFWQGGGVWLTPWGPTAWAETC
jgi:ABC-type antimicrobial peptide transport system permease subunit